MAIFGRNWLEDDNSEIGPFSHWKEDLTGMCSGFGRNNEIIIPKTKKNNKNRKKKCLKLK